MTAPIERAAGRAQPTLEEVAALAGVSRATVSRVVNDSPKVSEAARAAVRRAIEQLGYMPNRAARSLVTRRTNSIALIATEPETRFFSDPFFAGAVHGISHVLGANDYQLVLMVVQDDEDRERVERYLGGGHVDGVMLTSLHDDDPLPAHLASRGLPTVINGGFPAAPDVPSVDADNRGGAVDAVKHLAAGARRRIATITGPLDMCAARHRLEGYRDGMLAVGQAYDDDCIEVADFTREGGAAAMRTLLLRCPHVDAVFAASDLMAAGAISTLREEGRRIPEDVAVVGFDDSVVAGSTTPPLTTVRQPTARMGEESARVLLEHIRRPELRATHVVLPTELVIRASA